MNYIFKIFHSFFFFQAPEDVEITDFTVPLPLPETDVIDVLQSLVDRLNLFYCSF